MEALKINLIEDQDLFTNHGWKKRYDFVDFCVKYVNKYRARSKTKSVYMNTIRHFSDYQNEIVGNRLMADDLDKEHIEEFSEYMQSEKNLKNSTVHGIIGRIKYLLRKAQHYDIAIDYSFDEAKIKLEDRHSIALDKRDVARLFYFEGLTKSEEEMRDLFILGCQTGQRYSDYSRITKEHLNGEFIYMRTQKTKTPVCIPVDKYIREIFEKYNYDLPPARSIQQFNNAIKIICKKAKLNRIISYETIQCGKVVMIHKPLYMMVSSHTARRTFITTKISEGKPITSIAKVSGHKSLNSLALYDKTLLLDSAKIVSQSAI